MTDCARRLHQDRVHLQRRDERRVPRRLRAGRRRDERDAGHHAQGRRVRAARRRRRLHGRDAATCSATPGKEPSIPYVMKSMTQGCVSQRVHQLGAQPHVADHRLVARAGARSARAVRRPGRRRDRHVLHRRTSRWRWPSTTTMLAPVLSQPSLPVRRRQGAASARSALSDADLATVAARDDLCVLAMRFTGDPAVPARALRAPARGVRRPRSSRSRSTAARATRTTSRRRRTRS